MTHHHHHHRSTTKHSKPYKPFNKAFKQLLKDLMTALPDVKELKMMFMGYKLAKTLSKKCIYQMWRDTVQLSYLDFLKRHDDSFAFSPNFKLPPTISGIYAALAPPIIAKWKVLPPHVKDLTWRHVDILVPLCAKCQEYEAAKNSKPHEDESSDEDTKSTA